MSQLEIKENIKRLEHTLNMKCWSDGYIQNCKDSLNNYNKQLKP